MRKIIVTGGSRGIGLGIAIALVQNGDAVTAVARTLNPQLSDVMREHENLTFFPIDLADIANLPKRLSRLRELCDPIYGLVNNAGMSSANILSMMPDAVIADLIQMNVVSPLIVTRYLMRSMLTARQGRIINIASIVAGNGYPGLAAYSASKAAMVGFTHSLAREMGPIGVTVNAVAPGFIATEMTHGLTEKQRQQIIHRSALRRLPTIADVAATVQFLLSEAAANITGTVITVDAGNTA